jgi:hypothetical protein
MPLTSCSKVVSGQLVHFSSVIIALFTIPRLLRRAIYVPRSLFLSNGIHHTSSFGAPCPGWQERRCSPRSLVFVEFLSLLEPFGVFGVEKTALTQFGIPGQNLGTTSHFVLKQDLASSCYSLGGAFMTRGGIDVDSVGLPRIERYRGKDQIHQPACTEVNPWGQNSCRSDASMTRKLEKEEPVGEKTMQRINGSSFRPQQALKKAGES